MGRISDLILKKRSKTIRSHWKIFPFTIQFIIADAYLFRGQAYSSLGEFVAAGEDYNTAYTYYENLKDYRYMLHAQQGNITMFSMNGFYDLAKKERDELIEKLIELDLKQFLATEYYNQALDYRKTGNDSLQSRIIVKAERSQYDTLTVKCS